MIEVQISDRQSFLEVSPEMVRSAIEQTLEVEDVGDAEISIAILDDEQIRPINRDFLGHDCPTDAISFRLDDEDWDAAPSQTAGDLSLNANHSAPSSVIVGELIVSAETALRASAEAGWSPQHELVLYVVHATLHLTGHDDHATSDRQAMRRREREVLQRLGIQMPAAASVDRGEETRGNSTDEGDV